jgi:mannosyltransferase OCH1-like enzyme
MVINKNIILLIIVVIILFLIISIKLSKPIESFGSFESKLITNPPLTSIPKIIWTYWIQGIDRLPEFNKLCIESWREKNPNYIIHIIDDNTIHNYLDKNELPLYFNFIQPLQNRSDIVRLALLNKYGGVWMDSSIICLRPLDEWVINPRLTGFAIPQNSKIGSLDVFDSWFIACSKDSYLIKKWNLEYQKIWSNRMNNQKIYEHPYLTKIPTNLPDLEYLNIHLTFAACLKHDQRFKEEYDKALVINGYEDGFYHFMVNGWYDCDKFVKKNDNIINYELIADLKKRKTKILKFTGNNCGNYFQNFTRGELLDEKCTLKHLLKFKHN